MDKNIGLYIVLGFLLLCILLSLDKKEGFVVIREDLFETACAEGHESCNVFLSGQEGVECVDPDDKNLYNIPQEGRSKFTGRDFNMNPTSCSASAYANDELLGSQECDSEGQSYTLTGCSAYCTGPSSHPEYTINSPPDSIEPGSVQEVQGDSITCADGYTPAINTCFNKQNGEVSGETTLQACNGEDLEWFGEDDGIKIYCGNPGGTYNIMGCEASCYPRTGDHVGDYLINVADISEDDYSGNKERIETMDNRSSADLGDKVIHDSFPYSEPVDSVFAPNDTFNVLLNPEPGWSFRDGEGNITENCNIMGSDDIKNKYFVNGLYPDCDSTREECLNFNIVYSSGAPLNLEELREELPVENIFPEDQIPDQTTEQGLADLNKYKNALYYFRRFKNSDDNDEIEAQIRCDIDPTSDFHCSFTRSPGIKYVLGDPGRDCNFTCSAQTELASETGPATCMEYDDQDTLFSNTIQENGLTEGFNRLFELLGGEGNEEAGEPASYEPDPEINMNWEQHPVEGTKWGGCRLGQGSDGLVRDYGPSRIGPGRVVSGYSATEGRQGRRAGISDLDWQTQQGTADMGCYHGNFNADGIISIPTCETSSNDFQRICKCQYKR